MLLHFYKFNASGNSYLIVNGWEEEPVLSSLFVDYLCDSRYGVGAQSVLVMRQSSGEADFRFDVLVPSGRSASLPDVHAVRSMARFASVFQEDLSAPLLLETPWGNALCEFIDDLVNVRLPLSGVENFRYVNISWSEGTGFCFVNDALGLVCFSVDDLEELDMWAMGDKVAEELGKEVKIAFVETGRGAVNIRVYDASVRRELPCLGEVVSAVMLTFSFYNNWESPIEIQEPGQEAVYVSHALNEEKTNLLSITVRGPADFVFEGDIELLGE